MSACKTVAEVYSTNKNGVYTGLSLTVCSIRSYNLQYSVAFNHLNGVWATFADAVFPLVPGIFIDGKQATVRPIHKKPSKSVVLVTPLNVANRLYMVLLRVQGHMGKTLT